MSPSPPPIADSKDVLDLAAKGTGVLAAFGAGLWWIAKPLWFRFFEWTSRRVFRARTEEGKTIAVIDVIPIMLSSQRKLREDMEQMKADMDVQSGLLDTLPDLKAIALRQTETSERIETALDRLGGHVLTLTEKVGMLQGQQQRKL